MRLAGRWWLCILLFLATTLNYLDRQTLGILAPTIQRELGLDNAALGWLFSVFYYSYTFAQFAVGPLLDRVNLRWAYGLAVLLWSAVAALPALATGFTSLVVFRILLGVAEAANWPAAMRIVRLALAPEERPLGNGIFTSGTSVGALVAPALILGIAHWFGWRLAFVAVSSLGFLWFVCWARFTARPEWHCLGRPAPQPRQRSAYSEILAGARFWRVFLVTILVNPCLYFFLNWTPTYLVQQRGFAQDTRLGAVLTLIYIGLDLGYLTSGASALLLCRRGFTVAQARRPVLSTATILLAAAALAPHVASVALACAVLIAANFGAGMWIALYLTMAQEVSERDVSTAAGLLGGSGSLAGALAMWAVGRVTQQTSSFLIPFSAIAVAAAGAALAGWLVTRAPGTSDPKAVR